MAVCLRGVSLLQETTLIDSIQRVFLSNPSSRPPPPPPPPLEPSTVLAQSTYGKKV